MSKVSEENVKKLIENAYIPTLIDNIANATATAIKDTVTDDIPKIVEATLGHVMRQYKSRKECKHIYGYVLEVVGQGYAYMAQHEKGDDYELDFKCCPECGVEL